MDKEIADIRRRAGLAEVTPDQYELAVRKNAERAIKRLRFAIEDTEDAASVRVQLSLARDEIDRAIYYLRRKSV